MDNEYIQFSGEPGAPYSDIVVVDGKLLFLSGLVSEDFDTGDWVYGDIATETRQIMKNLKGILEAYGSDMDHVVRTEVLLRDFSQRDEMNAEYVKHFKPERMPARVCFGGVDLAGEAKIEIMVTATKN